ncbi:hypothetical protein HDU87_003354 [Geranomyces variabilis]|uniref:Uncharacterized protein n=1 Tax=Geranomyces variabilis TaxID=109894 RepID=A0AAD5XQM7_9FUNG|nr:hypothetical protein HDU87_003354 [Geranomyces variabilis]
MPNPPTPVSNGDIALKLAPGTDPHAVAQRLDLAYIGQVGELADHHVFRRQSDESDEAVTARASAAPEVLHVSIQVARNMRRPRENVIPVEEQDDAISQLDERLAHLEALTAPSLLAVTANGKGEDLKGSLLRSLQDVQEKLTRFARERRAIGAFLQKYGQVRDLLQAGHDFDESSGLDVVTKREILLSAEEDLVFHARELKQIATLKAELDNPTLKALGPMISRLATVEAQSLPLAQTESAIRERLLAAVNSYNQQVNSLSDLFILYEDMVSDLEVKVSQIEREMDGQNA